jgi:uncharacterized protein with FMN-binding domain
MRRVVPTLILTVIGLVALATFKSSAPATSAAASGVKAAASPAPATTAPPATAPPPAGTGAGTRPATSPPTAAPASQTYDGDAVDNRYGTVQVRITVQGNHITAVEPIQMPFDRSRSQYISEQAAPYLHDEVLQAQSAHIDVVSGATYTSESYMQSLQSALDKAHL